MKRIRFIFRQILMGNMGPHCTLHFRVSKSQFSYFHFMGLKHTFLYKNNKSLMYFFILIKIMLYK